MQDHMDPSTTIILIRNGETIWGQDSRILGRRDIGISDAGKLQAQQALAWIKDVNVTEILASPQARAIKTAEFFAQHFTLGIGRDPRLLDLNVGKWEGEFWETIAGHDDFASYFEGKAEEFPDGENLEDARNRAVSSVEEALLDNPHGAFVVLVTPAAIIQLILSHYLEMPASTYFRLQICSGSLSLIRLSPAMEHPQVLGINLGIPLRDILAENKSLGP